MKCPWCQQDDDRVIDSRVVEEGHAIRRRRKCKCCGQRFSTVERVERTGIKVVKKDGSREAFDRNRLKTGLEKACWKRRISDAQLEEIVRDIEQELAARNEAEIPSREIGEMVMLRLRAIDQVAYIRFASVYRQFEDVQDFVNEARPMLLNEDGRLHTPRYPLAANDDDPV